MDMKLFEMFAWIVIAGIVGGAGNALMTDNGFIMWKSETAADGSMIWRPGFLGNMFIGGIAALVSWGLYGPLSSYLLVHVAAPAPSPSPSGPVADIGLSVASLVGALLVGVGGARWLSNEVDKKLLRAAAVSAAGSDKSDSASTKIASATPADALNFAKSM